MTKLTETQANEFTAELNARLELQTISQRWATAEAERNPIFRAFNELCGVDDHDEHQEYLVTAIANGDLTEEQADEVMRRLWEGTDE